MGAIIGFIVVGVVFFVILGVVFNFFKFFLKNLPALLVLGGIGWVTYEYTSQVLWVVGLGLIFLLGLGIIIELKQRSSIRRECFPLIKTGNIEDIYRKFSAYDVSRKQSFLSVFSDRLSDYSIDKEEFLDELATHDFLEYAKKKFGLNDGSIVFEKKDGNSYLKKVWKDSHRNAVDALNTKILKSKNCNLQEQEILDKNKSPVVLIILKIRSKELDEREVDFNGAIDLD